MPKNQKIAPSQSVVRLAKRDKADRLFCSGCATRLVAAFALVVLLIGLPGCLTPQRLPALILKGQVLDAESRLPLSGAKIRLVYRGATKTLPAGKGESQFMDPIEVATAVSDSTGRFVAKAEERYVTRPLMDSWPLHPQIEVSRSGYEKGALFDMDLKTRYSVRHGADPQIAWPYAEHVEIFLHREAQATRGHSSP